MYRDRFGVLEHVDDAWTIGGIAPEGYYGR